jgi:hypothetical protein
MRRGDSAETPDLTFFCIVLQPERWRQPADCPVDLATGRLGHGRCRFERSKPAATPACFSRTPVERFHLEDAREAASQAIKSSDNTEIAPRNDDRHSWSGKNEARFA